MTSGAYAKEYNEVKELGAVGSQRTPEQNALAGFFTNTTSPPEMYNRTFRSVAASEGLGLVEQARLFAMLNMAGADAIINCWDDKAHWSFWRPVTAIRLGDLDGNPKTDGDPNWTRSVREPAVSRPSVGLQLRHRCVLSHDRRVLGEEAAGLRHGADRGGEPNQTRSYTQFTDVIDDTIDARVYIGIHFRAPDVQGAEIGKDVSRWLVQNYFEPVK